MDLGGWNTDFDPNLLGDWTEGLDPTRTSSVKDDDDDDDPLLTSTTLPAFSDDDPAISTRSLCGGDDVDKHEASPHLVFNNSLTMSSIHGVAISETTSITSARDERSTATRSSGGSSSSNRSTSVNHPLAISSAASCPTPGSSTAMGYPLAPSIIRPPSTSADLYSVDLSQALERSNIGMFATSNVATETVPPAGIPTANNSHLSTLANNFLLAASASFQPHAFQQATGATQHPQYHNHQQQHASAASSVATSSGSFAVPARPATSSQQPQNPQGSTTSTQPTASTTTTSSSLPPFYLFDAPIELRANFMANQRKLGLPIEHDTNSFYYGETVNGYHPQQLLKAGMGDPQNAASLLHVGWDPTKLPQQHRHSHGPPPKMIDARHGSNRRRSKGGQQKNEREQKRAQKITELIELLRLQIEEKGWQVEGRSKFNTLSKCAEYVKHMVRSTAEREDEIEKLKTNLEVKKRKAEEDKAMQESRSDFESVTSSLTSDTTGSRRSGNSSNDNQSCSHDDKKGRTNDGNHQSSSGAKPKHSKPRIGEAATEESSGEGKSGTGSGSGNSGSGSGGGPSAQGYSIGKTISTVSDLTDSNRCSSSNNSGSATHSGETDEIPEQRGGGSGGDQPSSSSICSDAAVASEKTSRGRHSGHKDVVFNNDKRSRKRPPAEVTSLERNFELDYEEVFDKSNIPQLIATTSGKIITWNECFAKATGYRKSEIERLTIFSLVRPDSLSKFFDIVAAALRLHDGKESTDGDSKPAAIPSHQVGRMDEGSKEGRAFAVTKESGEVDGSTKCEVSSEQAGLSSRLLDYTTITLPCVDFPAMKKRNQAISDTDSLIDPLTITVTLMEDKDPRKRCFHCVFTNCRGTNGALGSITPELLTSLFSTPPSRRKTHHSSGHKHKRMRMADDRPTNRDFQPPPPRLPKSIGGPPTNGQENNEGDAERDEPN